MDDYAANAWACPIPGCGFPLACRGAREGSYLKINPQIQTVVSSFEAICKSLNAAPPEWWNAEEEKEEDSDGEMIDLQPNYQSPPQKSKDDDDSPQEQDSQQTEAFPAPSSEQQHASASQQHDWMDAIAEANDNRSCGLPSQSPNCSPIAIMASQGTTSQQHQPNDVSVDNITPEANAEESSPLKRRESPTVRFQEEEEDKIPSVPTVLVASALSCKDAKLLDDLVSANKVKLATSGDSQQDKADYAICGNAEMETGDGFLVTRTYGYLLAVARGIPIVNSTYLVAKQANPTLTPDGTHKHQVIGDATSSEWMAPQRAIKAKSCENEGTKLLDGYTVLLFGDFASLPKSTKRSRSGVAKKSEEDSQFIYSSDRLENLLRTCGATLVEDVASLVGLDDDKKAIVMIRPDPHPRDWRAARKELEDYPTLCVIRGNWLLDSISDFRVKEFDEYLEAKR